MELVDFKEVFMEVLQLVVEKELVEVLDQVLVLLMYLVFLLMGHP